MILMTSLSDRSNGQPRRDRAQSATPLRCVTVDVEEYFHIEAAQGHVQRDQWDNWPSRVERNVDLLLEHFERHGQRGTFFVLGHVARRQPQLAKRIAQAGHEIASHGTRHDRLHRLEPQTFRQDLTESKQLIEDQTGCRIIGYRAPTFSLVPQTAWAIDVLVEAGFEYDASIFPVRHPWYGVPTAPLGPFMVRNHLNGPTLLEVPPLVWRMLCQHLPVAGGGYFRLLPLAFMNRGLAQAQRRGRPAVLYFHPWEFDPQMPRMPLPLLGRLRTYTGLARAAARLDRIMNQPARWLPISAGLAELRDIAKRQPVFDLASVRSDR